MRKTQRGLGLVGIIIILALIGGGIYLATRNSSKPTETTTATTTETVTTVTTNTQTVTTLPASAPDLQPGLPPETKTIVYTNNGFEPTSTTVKVGEMVTFVNQSSHGMQVAGGKHPEHDGDFEAETIAGNGESFTHVFTETGTRLYHNHLEETDEGTIVVE